MMAQPSGPYTLLPCDPEALLAEVPQAMQEARRWLIWKALPNKDRAKKPRKVPFYVDGSPRRGQLDTPDDWARLGTLDQALAAVRAGGYAGVGFALGPDDGGRAWQGVDLDATDARAELSALIDQLPGYVERSPSGTGVHAIGYGEPFEALGSNASGIEAYCAGRYFTMTGDAISGELADLSVYVQEMLTPLHGGGAGGKARADPSSLGDSFFAKTNAKALMRLGDWVQALFPKAKTWRDGYRVASADLGRDLEEDLQITPEGVMDFGEERGRSPIDLVIDWGPASDLISGATWLCERMGVEPAALGYRRKLEAPPPPTPEDYGLPPARSGSNVVSLNTAGMDWQDRLQRSEKGNLKASAFNLRLILEHDPAWKGVIGWCVFSARVMKRRLPPYAHAARGEWVDVDDAELRFWLGEHYGIEPKGQDLADPVMGVAMAAPFHPVRDYLDRLTWDGVPRVDHWLGSYLGCVPYGDEDENVQPRQRAARYIQRVGALTLIQAVARVRKPGCKADYVLILEGAQGRRKSTSLRVLFGDDWFSDTPIDIGSKDAYESIRGLWCFEMAELDSLNKADATRAKAFFSSASDRFRMPYGHRAEKHKRQCVVCGTTNQHAYLKDQTGNRRYWPVQCGEIDIEALVEVRDQLWAEADHRYQAGEPWWPQEEDQEVFEAEQDARVDADVWEPLVQDYLHRRMEEWLTHTPPALRRGKPLFLTGAEVMKGALDLDPGAMRRPEQTRLGYIMQSLGWRTCRPRTGELRVRGYQPSIGALDAFVSARDERRVPNDGVDNGENS